MKLIYSIIVLCLFTSSCSMISSLWSSDEEESEAEVTQPTPKPAPPSRVSFFQTKKKEKSISIFDNYNLYTFYMEIDRTIIFENNKRNSKIITGKKSKKCQITRSVHAQTRDILKVDKKPRLFRLIRSVQTHEKKAKGILMAVDEKSGNNTFEIICPSIKDYTNINLEDQFDFKIIHERNKLRENYI